MINFDWLAGLPIPAAKFLVILSLLAALIFAWSLPAAFIKKGAASFRSWQNFKYWILILVAVQIVIYIYF